MLPLPRGAVWQTLFLLCAVLFINEVRSEGRVVCYYTNWSVYRPGTAKFNPQNINPYLCTHLVYAFGGFTKDNQMKPFDKYQDIEQGGYAKFTGLKTYNKQLKTMIAIGGWNEASSRFSPLMANPERRQQFIKNILKFLRQNHFDGIDLDWEYPAQREGGKQRDRDNYAQFVQELRAEFEREAQKTGRTRLLVTMAVPAGIENIEKGYDIPKLNKYLDWFNVLSYDFHSSHEPSANHHAPLYSLEEESEYNYDAELNIDYSIKYYLKAGADRDKLVLGIPTYGRSYTLINEESTEIGAPSEGPGEQGDATREKGYLAYYEICQNLKEDPEWTVVQPNPNAMGPYAYRRNQWVGYDDEAIVRKKAQYVVEHGLGGIMFWAIDNDDFRGTCTGKPYPLIEAAKEAMMESLGLGINEVAKPNSPKKPSRSRSRENSSSKLNRIGGSSEGKGAGRTTLSSGRRRVQASSTTTTTPVPETTIRLTNAEGSSLYIGGRVTTPAPPTTPDPGTDFKCEEEGFFQHPRDCKKYYWCLDSGPSGLGIVGHQFTCPSGLYFNPAADSCDFARNVPCKTKKSTTAAPVSSTTTTTTTSPRPTAALNRITAATSRTSFFRTTTTTSTTPAPIEYEEEEEEEVDDEAPAHTKDRDAEEDPQVIKELIELIRKVGGLEELEKHLLRKDDGTISIKGSASNEAGGATTPTPISKNLYDKVLSKPNTFNSFRNRFTSSSLFRKSSGQTSTEEPTSNKQDSGESQSSEGALNSGYSKYSSVVRGNSRQGPQNEGLDKLTEFDGFLKEKKQYVTINRHRGAFRGQDDEEEVEEKEEFEEEELSSRSKSTKRPTNTVTPSYASIRRTRPTTVRAESDEEIVSEEEVRTSKESDEKRTYTSLNRNRARITATESSQAADETATNINRYKYLERTRPTNRIPTTSRGQEEEISLARNEEKQEDDDQNVTVQLNGATNDSKQNSTQTTTRIYANIGRRTTTTTETPITTTQETPTRYNLLENINYNNETPEPNLPTTITATSDSPTTLSITIKNTNPQIIPIQTTTTSDSTTSRTTTTSPSNNIELTDAISTITTLPPNFDESADSYEALDLSLDVNSLVEKSPKTASTTVEPQKSEVADATTPTTTTATRTTTKETLTSTATASGTGTGTATTTTATPTDPTDQNADANDEVTNLTINKRLRTQQKQQQQQYKFITRTRNVTKATTTTTTNTDTDTINANENENETTSSNNKFTKDTLKKKTSLKTTGNRSSGGTSTDDKLSSNIRGNTVKYSGGRRQQQKQQQKQLNESLTTRKNLNHNQQLDSTKDSTNIITTTDSTPTNEFLGSISSPRPFGFPRRRTRPNSPTTSDTQTTTTTIESSSEDEQSLVKTRLSASNAAKNKKYQFNRARYSTTTTAAPITSTTIATPTSATPRTASGLFVPKQLYKSNRNRTATTTNQVRTTTATTTIVTAIPVATTTQTRRPVVSVRRRKINSPNGSLGIAYQTATTSQQTSQTAAAGATTATATNTYASTIKSDELLAVTTATTTSVELPTTFNKQQQQQQQQQRYRNKLVTPAATATTTNTELTAPTTTTSSAQQFTAAAITLNNAVNNQKSYLTNTKYRLKLPATTLSTGDSSLATVTTNVEGAAATVPTTTASNDIIQQQQQQQQQQQSNANTKQPSTVLRRKFQTRRLITTTTVGPTDDSATELPRTPNPLFKRRFSLIPSATAITIISTSTPADGLTTTFFADGFDADDASDQVAKSSIHTSHFNQFIQKAEDNEQQVGQRTLSSGIKASSLKSKTNIETATTHAALEPNPPYVESITRRMGTVAATTEFTAAKRKSNDIKRRPQKYTPTTPQTPIENITARRGQPAREVVLNRRRPNKYAAGDTYDRLNGNQPAPVKTPTRVSNTYRPVVDYDYYDDENERIVGNTEGQQLKVILHGRGIIECLDQGNFPHPLSCRKFISCAKFETGGVVGWEYTCPKGLSYDPVGGMCNWAAGLGCKE